MRNVYVCWQYDFSRLGFTMFIEWCNDRHHRIGESVATDHLRDSNNTTGIGENSAEIGDDTAGIVNIAAKVIPCLNSVLNGDWSNSVLRRQFLKGIAIDLEQSSCSDVGQIL